MRAFVLKQTVNLAHTRKIDFRVLERNQALKGKFTRVHVASTQEYLNLLIFRQSTTLPACIALNFQRPDQTIKIVMLGWAGTAQTSDSSLDRVQKRLRHLVGIELFSITPLFSHRRNIARLSLFDCYFHGGYWGKLQFLDSPIHS